MEREITLKHVDSIQVLTYRPVSGQIDRREKDR